MRKSSRKGPFTSAASRVAFLIAICATLVFSSVGATEFIAEQQFNQDTLQAVSELYGISEDQAVHRLAKETDAAITLQSVSELPISSYAGSWFDDSSMTLKVAVSNPDDLVYLRDLDVEPVIVRHSLETLEKRLDKAMNALGKGRSSGSSLVSAHIDIRENSVALTVREIAKESARAVLRGAALVDGIDLQGTESIPELSTGPVRAATGTRNLTWEASDGEEHPCSVGAAVEDGFVTAGHCGAAGGGGNQIGDSTGAPLGTVEGSTWFASNPSIDSGYVETDAGWTPSATVQGYSDGIFSVSALNGGLIQYTIGTTVCRYGYASGGPHCGTIDAFDVTVTFGQFPNQHTVTGLTQVDGGCTDDGDSGGPHVAGVGVIQGTNTGGDPGNTCPSPADHVWFQPITDTLDEFGVIMLTSHGANPPTFGYISCPDEVFPPTYQCSVLGVFSQGEVDIMWTTNTGASSTTWGLSGNCSIGQTVHVTLKATNPYGSTTNNYSFPCSP